MPANPQPDPDRLDSPPILDEPVHLALLGSSITLLNNLEAQAEVAFTLPTPAGESPPFYLLRHAGVPFWYVPFHGINFMSASDNVDVAFTRTWYVLFRLGVREVLSGAAAGCVNSKMKPGDIVAIDDFIDFSTSRPRSILTEIWERLPHTFAAFVPPLCPDLTKLLIMCQQAYRFGGIFDQGTLAQFEGHRFETPAEIKMAGRAGADLVAHHNATEAIYARELGIHYAALLYITNYAAGLSPSWVPAASYEEMAREGKAQCTEILLDTLAEAAQRKPECTVCQGPDRQPDYVSEHTAISEFKPVFR